MDWLTNISVPRINQYDPVDYLGYCEKYLQYNPLRRSQWELDMARYGLLDTAGLSYDLRTMFKAFKDNLYPIDDTCKWILAQMFPVKHITKKRII